MFIFFALGFIALIYLVILVLASPSPRERERDLGESQDADFF